MRNAGLDEAQAGIKIASRNISDIRYADDTTLMAEIEELKNLSVIPGLYVAGVDNGSLYCSPYYENEGASLGIAYTSGIVAADCMLEFLNA